MYMASKKSKIWSLMGAGTVAMSYSSSEHQAHLSTKARMLLSASGLNMMDSIRRSLSVVALHDNCKVTDDAACKQRKKFEWIHKGRDLDREKKKKKKKKAERLDGEADAAPF